MAITNILLLFILFLIASLPLYLAVKLLGGKTGILKAIFVNILAAIVVTIAQSLVSWGNILGLVLLIWMYREFFRLKWIKALLVWILQIIIVIAGMLLLIGISFL